MRERLNGKFFKKLYKILTVFLAVCWVSMGVAIFGRVVLRSYFYPVRYKEEVFEYADYYGLERALVFSVIKVESGFNEDAKSHAGAVGLMQITEDTGAYIASKLGVENYNLTDVKTNINFGCYYIKYLFLRFKDMNTALIAYNAGEGNVSLWLMNNEYSDDKITLKSIPFNETRDYIKKINENFSKYKKLYGNILDKPKNFE
ncbi:MAG: lytic transglycosylase domain-containing protein [Clostridia bacterium]|nr:lytic transglycosylase domain-containing protein [Clostridia bacterium]